jgi:Flp pilus assembly protein TadB
MTEQTPAPKKGKPTPARKEQEAARKRPLVAPKTKESKKAAAAKAREERLAARDGYAAGDDKFLPKRDAGPQRRMLRDIVDARWLTIGEFLLPFMFVAVLTPQNGFIATILNIAVLVLFALYLIDTAFISGRAKKLLTNKFGAGKVDKGIWLYIAFRAMYPRVIRLPKAQVRRGHKF